MYESMEFYTIVCTHFRWVWSCLQGSLGKIYATTARHCGCKDSERLDINPPVNELHNLMFVHVIYRYIPREIYTDIRIRICKEVQSGNKASQFFFTLVLALLVSLTSNAGADRFQYLIHSGVGWVLLAILQCFSKPLGQLSFCFRAWAVYSVSLYSFHAVWAACKLFTALPSHSASFQTIQPGF